MIGDRHHLCGSARSAFPHTRSASFCWHVASVDEGRELRSDLVGQIDHVYGYEHDNDHERERERDHEA